MSLWNWNLHIAKLWRTSTLTGIALGLTLYYALRPYFGGRRCPPGPFPVPFIGHTYYLFSRNVGKFQYERWRRYGSVMSTCIPGLLGWYVHLFDYKTIYEAFVTHGDTLSDRPSNSVMFTKPGLIFGTPKAWRLLRSHAIMVLKDHGMGKSSMEPKVSAELVRLVEALNQLAGSAQSSERYQNFIILAVSNLTNQIMFGRRLEYDDDLAISLSHLPHYFLRAAKYNSLFIFKFLPWDVTRYRHYRKYYTVCREFFMSEITKRKVNLDVENPTDYIESFLAQGVKTGEACFNDDEELLSCISQLYAAGSDTTSASLHWALFYLINHPDEQEKLYQEACKVIGDRAVCLADKPNMHYTQAVIWELLRVSSLATVSLLHKCNQDTVVDGRLIPEGTPVSANLWSVNHNEEAFPDPAEFIPERFLNSRGEYETRPDQPVLPFSIGKRMCPGAEFAKTMLFMFLVTIVQRFKLSRTTKEKLPVKGFMGLGHETEPYEILFTCR